MALWNLDAACGQLAGEVKDRTQVLRRIDKRRAADLNPSSSEVMHALS